MSTYDLTVELTDIDGAVHTCGADKTADLRFVKERYTPFTLLKGVFIQDFGGKRIAEVRLYRGNTLLHRGTADSAEYIAESGAYKLRIVSYGYSKQLGQDFAEPGIIQQPNLQTIIGRAGITGVDHQDNTASVRYVYFDDKTTIWDAACIYTMKAYRQYPFIRGANTVRCTAPGSTATFVRSAAAIVRCSRGQRLGNILSDVYTQDIDNNWTYHMSSAFAGDMNVTRKKYYPADREWVYDLNDLLKYYMYFSNRGREYIGVTFKEYFGEDICDKERIWLPGGEVLTPEISGVTVRATPKGVFTDLLFYFDSYCNTN